MSLCVSSAQLKQNKNVLIYVHCSLIYLSATLFTEFSSEYSLMKLSCFEMFCLCSAPYQYLLEHKTTAMKTSTAAVAAATAKNNATLHCDHVKREKNEIKDFFFHLHCIELINYGDEVILKFFPFYHMCSNPPELV